VTAASPLGGRKIAVPLDVQEEPIIKTSVDAYVAPKPLEIAKEADFKTDIAILIGSKSGLRDAILLREILGQPRGLRELELP
jgi:hypothetical protein